MIHYFMMNVRLFGCHNLRWYVFADFGAQFVLTEMWLYNLLVFQQTRLDAFFFK